MVDVLDKTYAKARKAYQMLYENTCTIKRFADILEGNLVQQKALVLVEENVPCYLTDNSIAPTTQTDVQNEINYNLLLILAPEVEIKPGDTIDVRVKDGSYTYLCESTGEAIKYPTHQEVILKRRDRA